MAQDYPTIPATSVSVKHVFSKFHHICSSLRNSLKENTIKMALLTKVWIWDGLFEMMLRKVVNGTGNPRVLQLSVMIGLLP